MLIEKHRNSSCKTDIIIAVMEYVHVIMRVNTVRWSGNSGLDSG